MNYSVAQLGKLIILAQEDVEKLTNECKQSPVTMPKYIENDIINKELLQVITTDWLATEKGSFKQKIEASIVRPTLKKIGLEPSLMNYMSVSYHNYLKKLAWYK